MFAGKLTDVCVATNALPLRIWFFRISRLSLCFFSIFFGVSDLDHKWYDLVIGHQTLFTRVFEHSSLCMPALCTLYPLTSLK